MLSSAAGVLHFATSIIALLAGTLVLIWPKGSKKHKRVGYIYFLSMIVLLSTSFMIYRLHGTFGILHWFAVVSCITLFGGMLPMLFKWPNNYITYHFSFMYWSVIGLYCAFFAEIFTRIPFLFEIEKNIVGIFYGLIGITTAIVGGIGAFYFRKYKEKWLNYHKIQKKTDKK